MECSRDRAVFQFIGLGQIVILAGWRQVSTRKERLKREVEGRFCPFDPMRTTSQTRGFRVSGAETMIVALKFLEDPSMFAVFSTSLSSQSRSRILARYAHARMEASGQASTLFDLAEKPATFM